MVQRLRRIAFRTVRVSLLSTAFALLVPTVMQAKKPGLVAIVVSPEHDGQSYQQIADFTLNGKDEVYLCVNDAPLDKSSYHKLSKVVLSVGMSMERAADGRLTLTQANTAPACAVPANLKFEHSGGYALGEITDATVIGGEIVGSSDPAQTRLPTLKLGTMVVLIAAPDAELAEYLRAERTGTVAGWQTYLSKYAAGPHSSDAKKSLEAIYLQMGTADLQAYLGSASGAVPDYSKLKEARDHAAQARTLEHDDPTAVTLENKVIDTISQIAAKAAEKLNNYRKALAHEMAGYVNLTDAETLAGGALKADPSIAQVNTIENQVTQARVSFDNMLRDCKAQIVAKQPDAAARILAPFKPFAAEDAEVDQDVKAIAGLYTNLAQKQEATSDWDGAIASLEKASALSPSSQLGEMLATARKQALAVANKNAADRATQQSQQFESDGDIVQAYEVLDNLPPGQHELVTDRIAALKDKYVPAAESAAAGLQKAHQPINGLADEIGIVTAYGYLTRCYRITNDSAVGDKIAILGDSLSNYYLQQGKHYAEKPDGSGVNVGWEYLREALPYKSQSVLGALHDELTLVQPVHLLKSKLSLRVEFRDQTSRREAVDFAAQLTDALATGLESSGLPVLVVRPQDATKVQPNFQLVGDVVRHEIGKSQEQSPIDSQYRSGEQQIPNPTYLKASQDYEHANNELISARSVLQGAEARGKKDEIKKAQAAVSTAEAATEALRVKLDAIPQTVVQDVIRHYTYTKVTYHLRTSVELQFRVIDSAGTAVFPRATVVEEKTHDYSSLQNVKAEDTQGVRSEGVLPNDNDFFETDENVARDELIRKAEANVKDLPAVIVASADQKAGNGDVDGAAELYVLYLNSTSADPTAERARAQKFLFDHFNFKTTGKDDTGQ